MKVNVSSFTIAEYCEQMDSEKIVVNKEYQRSDKVWPPAARSYLIDTILSGYPIPKLALYQHTDLKSRKTVKEIVDGQQRSRAIYDYFNNAFRITSRKSQFSGHYFKDLEEEHQQNFVEYSLDVDLFIGATEEDIRQMFRRMNSYTIPLNAEEQRHATYQGAFKWFIVDLTEQYASLLKKIGVFTERQLTRMSDARLFTEIVEAMESGIRTYRKQNLDAVYRRHDDEFQQEDTFKAQIRDAIDLITKWDPIHHTDLMKQATFMTLLLAIIHSRNPVAHLQEHYEVSTAAQFREEDEILSRLGQLIDVLQTDDPPAEYEEFVEACQAGTNTRNKRAIRFREFCATLLAI